MKLVFFIFVVVLLVFSQVSTIPITSGGPPTGSAGGKLSGTYPNPGLNAASTDLTDSSSLARLASPALTGTPTAPTPVVTDNSTTLPTTAYVTTAIANAITAAAGRDLVTAATAAVLPNTPTFTHVDSGIGSFLTSSTNSVLVIDGYTPLLNDRVLVKNEVTAANNGIYKVTQLGVGAVTPWIITRALDYDQPSDMNNTIVPVANNGTANPKTSWIMTSTVATIDTDAVTFTSFTPNGSNIVTSVSPGVGIGHFAGSTQVLTSSLVISADLNITTTTCTAPQVLTAISATAVGTCNAPLLTQNSQSAAYTTVLGDAGKMIFHPAADTTARTFTIDSNANVAYILGTCITFVNETLAGVLTIAITSDTLLFAGAATTGSRTLAASNIATACKITTTKWIISGSSGLT